MPDEANVPGRASPAPPTFEQIYDELRRLAASYLERERNGHSLQPTGLVHEAWLRLARRDPATWNDRTHVLATCARAMRHVLVDWARAHRRHKRGGDGLRVTLTGRAASEGDVVDLLALDDALQVLQRQAERQARLVEMRCFAGATMAEAAEALGVSERTAATDWRFARAWLTKQMRDEP